MSSARCESRSLVERVPAKAPEGFGEPLGVPHRRGLGNASGFPIATPSSQTFELEREERRRGGDDQRYERQDRELHRADAALGR